MKKISYVEIYDLLKNGAEDCLLKDKREDVKPPYIVCCVDDTACCGRGEVDGKFKDIILFKHYMFPSRSGQEGPYCFPFLSVGNLESAKIKLEKMGFKVNMNRRD